MNISTFKKLLVASVFLGVFFAFSATGAKAADEFTFGVSLSLTGKYEKMGQMQSKGYRLWEQHINKTGGILGRKVRIILHDDKSDPETARFLYKRLIEKDRVDFLFAPFSSTITEAILPLSQEHGYSLIAAGAAADRLWKSGYTHIFGLFTPASKIPVSFLEMAVLEGLQTLAVVYANDSFSTDIADGARKWARWFELDIILDQPMAKQEDELQKLAGHIQEIRPDILMVCGQLDETVNLRLALKTGCKCQSDCQCQPKADCQCQPKAFYTPVGPGMTAFYERLQEASDLVFSSSQWEHDGGYSLPGSREFISAFKENYNQEPSYFAATAYAAGQIMASAITRVGSSDRQEINEALFNLDTMNIIGRYAVDRTGKPVKNFTMVIQVKNGKREVVWPLKLRTATPEFE